MAKNPGLHFEEGTSLPAILVPASFDFYGMVGRAKRGPTEARTITSWNEFERIYGGIFGTEHLPQQVRAFFDHGGKKLIVARILGTGTAHGSARLLDCDNFATALVLLRYAGEGDDIAVSTAKHSTTLTAAIPPKITCAADRTFTFAASSKTLTCGGASPGDWLSDGYAIGQKIQISTPLNAGVKTIAALSATVMTFVEAVTDEGPLSSTSFVQPVSALVADASGFEVGDVFRSTDGTDTAVGEIFAVDAANGRIEFPPLSPALSSAVASGSVIATSSKHLCSTALAVNAGSGDTQVTLKSAKGVSKGSVLLFFRDNVQDGAPIPRTVTAPPSGNTVALNAALGQALSEDAKVVSCEFYAAVYQGSTKLEEYPYLSMESTFAEKYISDRLGSGIAFTLGSDTGVTSSETLDDNDTSLTVGGALSAGSWYLLDTSGGQDGSTGVYLHVKGYSSGAISFDSVGDITQVASGKKLWNLTPVITGSDSNLSDTVVMDELSVLGAATSDNTNGEHRKIPKPVTAQLCTGGLDGSTPTGVAQILGSNTPGAKTGVYAFQDSPDFLNLVAFAIPGLANDTISSRATLDAAAKDWAEANGPAYISSVPSLITQPSAARAYRQVNLGFSSSYMALYFPWLKIVDPNSQGTIITVPPDGYQLGLMASRAARRGIHTPPANEPYKGVKSLTAVVGPTDHELLNEAGVNVIMRRGLRGFCPFGARTMWVDKEDGTGRHFLNVRLWFNFIKATLAQGMDGVLFEPANASIFQKIEGPVGDFMAVQFAAGAMGPSNPSDAYFVQADSETTRDVDLAGGQVYCHIGTVAAGAVEAVTFLILGYSGSVRVREV